MAVSSAIAGDSLTRRVVSLIHAGHTLNEVAAGLGLHRSTVYRRKAAAGVPASWRPMSAAERQRIRELIEQDLSRRDVARIVRRGLGTVARVAVSLQDDGGEQHRTRAAYRCPQCGQLVQIRPCVICAAQQYQCQRKPHG